MTRTLTRRRTARDEVAYTPADDGDDEDQAQETTARGARRGGRREALNTEEDKPAPRRGSRRAQADDDDDEDEKPARGSRRGGRTEEEPPQKVGGKGWGEYERTKSSAFPDDFKVTDEAVLIKLLDEEPFHVFLQHWIERKGKKSWICLENKCPLCDDAGDKPSQQICFNVVDFTDPEDPQVKMWRFGPMVADILRNYSKDKKTSPINKDDLYWSVSKETKKSKTTYYITPVKERDVADDWDIEPLGDEDFEEFESQMYGDDAIHVNTRAELREIAREIMND